MPLFNFFDYLIKIRLIKFMIIYKLFSIFLYILSILTISGESNNLSNLIKTYNFVDQQNYILDLMNSHLQGINLYFYSKDNLTLFILDINPQLTLNIQMKMYTNDTLLTNIITNHTIY